MVGVECGTGDKKVTCRARLGIIMATGGITGKPESLDRWVPSVAGKGVAIGGPNNDSTAMMISVRDVGVPLSHMQYIASYPCGIVVNGRNGPYCRWWFITKIKLSELVGLPSWTAERIEAEFKAGKNLWKCNIIEELCRKSGVNLKGLKAQLAQWNKAVESKNDTQYGRTDQQFKIGKGPYYMIRMFPWNNLSCGGVRVTEQFQVLGWDMQPVKGFYAAVLSSAVGRHSPILDFRRPSTGVRFLMRAHIGRPHRYPIKAVLGDCPKAGTFVNARVDAARCNKARGVVGVVVGITRNERGDFDFAQRMNKASAPEAQADVRDIESTVFLHLPEKEVTSGGNRRAVVNRHTVPGAHHLISVARYDKTRHAPDVTHKSRAVKTQGACAAPKIRDAYERAGVGQKPSIEVFGVSCCGELHLRQVFFKRTDGAFLQPPEASVGKLNALSTVAFACVDNKGSACEACGNALCVVRKDQRR